MREFYVHMEVKDETHIEAEIGGKKLKISPRKIAKVMDYKKPKAKDLTWPKEGREIGEVDIVNALTDRPDGFVKGKFMQGKLSEPAKLLNKIVSTNLVPHANESKPALADATVIYVLMKEDERVDWSQFIFDQIVKFRNKGITPSPSRLPFPCLITTLCEDAGIPYGDSDEKGFHGQEQAINKASIAKSKAMSRPPIIGSSSRPTAKTQKERMDEWGDIIMASHRRIERHLSRHDKHHDQQRRWMKHLLEKLPEEDRYPFTDEEDLGGSE